MIVTGWIMGDGRMEENKYGKYGRRKKRLRAAVVFLLSVLVLFGGRKTWKTILTDQAENVAQEGREKLPVVFGWVFRHYYPAGAVADKRDKEQDRWKRTGEEEKIWWLDWLWESLPLYRQREKNKETFLTSESEDPAYKNYLDSRQFVSEYEALLGWGGEDTKEGRSAGEGEQDIGQSAADINQETGEAEDRVKPGSNDTEAVAGVSAHAGNGTIYSREQLADYDFMMSHFFSVHPSTTAGRDIMNAKVFLDKDFRLTRNEDGPQILIYHTHSQETFADYGPDNTEATVTGLGTYLTELLQAKGYQVIHDTSSYDLKGGKLDRSKAYTYALEGITEILQENPSVQVILDIHRDGVREGYHMVSQVNGKSTAPIMFFLGMSRTPTEIIEYLPNPNLENNLAFSFQMQLKAAEYFPGLTRKIYLKGLRYNLHLRPCSSLIEAGAQTNTYEEAKNAMEPLAEVLDMVLQGK